MPIPTVRLRLDELFSIVRDSSDPGDEPDLVGRTVTITLTPQVVSRSLVPVEDDPHGYWPETLRWTVGSSDDADMPWPFEVLVPNLADPKMLTDADRYSLTLLTADSATPKTVASGVVLTPEDTDTTIDLMPLLPIAAATPTSPITRGPRGEGFTGAEVVDGALLLYLEDGGVVDAGPVEGASVNDSSLAAMLQAGNQSTSAIQGIIEDQSGWINANLHGVVADGITDDSDAWNALVQSAQAGDTITWTGKSMLHSRIVWKSGISIVGKGWGKSILATFDDTGENYFSAIEFTPNSMGASLTNTIDDVTFADFEIDGSGLSGTQRHIGGKGIFGQFMRRCQFLNLYIHDTIGTGLGTDYMPDCLIHGCLVVDCGRNWFLGGGGGGQANIGIGTGGWADESLTISDCTTISTDPENHPAHWGIFVEWQDAMPYRGRGIRIVNCSATGAVYGFGDRGTDGTTFANCTAYNNTMAGFKVETAGRNGLVTGCSSYDNGTDGYATDFTLEGPYTFRGNKSFNNAVHGFNIPVTTAVVPQIAIEDNEIYENGGCGIRLYSTGEGKLTDLSIRGNRIWNNGQSQGGTYLNRGIRVDAHLTRFEISHNMISDTQEVPTQMSGIFFPNSAYDLIDGRIAGNFLYNSGLVLGASNRTNVTIRDNAPGEGVASWSEITDKPTTFPSDPVTWSAIESKPTEFYPSTHAHAVSDVTGLEGTLADKAGRSALAVSVLDYGAVGDGETDDTAAILAAQTAAVGGPVALAPSATHRVTQPIQCTNIVGNGAEIHVSTDNDGLIIGPTSRANDLTVRITADSWTKAALRVDTASGFNVISKAKLSNINLIGKSAADGVAIEADDSGVKGVVCFLQLENVRATKFEVGVRFIATHSQSWMNGNDLNLYLYDIARFVELHGECDYNTVSGQAQPSASSLSGVRCSGTGNRIPMVIWDADAYPAFVQYDFSPNGIVGSHNRITGTGLLGTMGLTNANPSNSVDNSRMTGLVLPAAKDRAQYRTKSGTVVNTLVNFLGIQDDVLKLADKNYVVSSTPEPTSGVLRSAFRFGQAMPAWVLTAGGTVTVTIDLTNQPLSSIGVIGVQFGFANFSDQVTIATENGAGSQTVHLVSSNNASPVVHTTGTVAGVAHKIIVTMTTTDARTVRVAGIFASSGAQSQKSLVQTDGGNRMWGDLEWGEAGIGPVLTSPDGGKHRLTVDNDGLTPVGPTAWGEVIDKPAVVVGDGIANIVSLTQAAYDVLTPDPTTLYIIAE